MKGERVKLGVEMMTRKKSDEIPVWKRDNLTIEEAAAYTGVGMTKLRELSDADSCDFVLWVGTKRLLKREKLDPFLDSAFSI